MKLSKLSIPYRTVSKLTTVLVFALLFGGASLIAEGPLGLLLFIAFVFFGTGVIFIYEYLYWQRYVYRITEEGLEISSGVFSKKTRDIPLRRIQNVDVDRTVFQRFFGIAKVNVETAGGDTSEANFRYLEYGDAKDVQKEIRELKNRRTEPEKKKIEKEDFRLTDRNLLILSAVSINPRTAISYAVLAVFAGTALIGQLGIGTRTLLSSPGLISLVTLAVFAAWVSSGLSSLTKFYDFKLVFRDNAIEYERGLLHRSSGTIPEEKIQNIIIEENFLKRWLGYATLKVETAGYGPAQQQVQGSETAIPLAKKDRIVSIAEEIGEYEMPELDYVNQRARTRYFRRYLLLGSVLLLLMAVLNVYTGFGAVVYLVPLTLIIGSRKASRLKWANIGYSIGQKHLFTRKGFWNRRTYTVPYFRVQNLVKTQTVFQKRWGMASVNIDTAGSAFTNPVIPDMQEEKAVDSMEDIFSNFKTSL